MSIIRNFGASDLTDRPLLTCLLQGETGVRAKQGSLKNTSFFLSTAGRSVQCSRERQSFPERFPFNTMTMMAKIYISFTSLYFLASVPPPFTACFIHRFGIFTYIPYFYILHIHITWRAIYRWRDGRRHGRSALSLLTRAPWPIFSCHDNPPLRLSRVDSAAPWLVFFYFTYTKNGRAIDKDAVFWKPVFVFQIRCCYEQMANGGGWCHAWDRAVQTLAVSLTSIDLSDDDIFTAFNPCHRMRCFLWASQVQNPSDASAAPSATASNQSVNLTQHARNPCISERPFSLISYADFLTPTGEKRLYL